MKITWKGVLKAIASNIGNTPMLIKWSWYDWIVLGVLLFIYPYSLFVALVWLGIKLSIGEDFIELKHKEKALHYYQRELTNLRYQVSALMRMKSVSEKAPTSSQPESDQEPKRE